MRKCPSCLPANTLAPLVHTHSTTTQPLSHTAYLCSHCLIFLHTCRFDILGQSLVVQPFCIYKMTQFCVLNNRFSLSLLSQKHSLHCKSVISRLASPPCTRAADLLSDWPSLAHPYPSLSHSGLPCILTHMAIVLASPAQPISLGPMEEAERKTYEQYQTPQTNQYTSSISREGYCAINRPVWDSTTRWIAQRQQ
jgi:hypothetical protein